MKTVLLTELNDNELWRTNMTLNTVLDLCSEIKTRLSGMIMDNGLVVKLTEAERWLRVLENEIFVSQQMAVTEMEDRIERNKEKVEKENV